MGAGTVASLRDAVQRAWSADTSNTADWTESNPAEGQCAVTACVVQDHFGGDIVNTVATLPSGRAVSHYFNVIDGENVDFTFHQFPEGTSFSAPEHKTKGLPSTRAYCMSFQDTRDRYELLSSRVCQFIGKPASPA
ncbi:hypothetical protein OG203_01470 [Nocardia sp. NBC_01499]|uniref:YunG family protein n=1 Tax=Nocardia sp. NBC_01499 TaxID=2903597 RepID=UPI0038656E11